VELEDEELNRLDPWLLRDDRAGLSTTWIILFDDPVNHDMISMMRCRTKISV